jgi:hypothetical protein
MFRTYLVAAILALAAYGYGQYRGWSVMPSEAEEFQRRRIEQRADDFFIRGGPSRSSGSSGHK